MRSALVYLISILMIVLCIPMLLCTVYAVIDQPTWCLSSDLLAFITSIVIGLSFGYWGYHRSQSDGIIADFKPTAAFLMVTLTWVISASFGALPYYLFGWFEHLQLDGGPFSSQSLLGQEASPIHTSPNRGVSPERDQQIAGSAQKIKNL